MSKIPIQSEVNGRVAQIDAQVGDSVRAGAVVAVLESMKMEISVEAPRDGTVCAVLVEVGQVVEEGQSMFELS